MSSDLWTTASQDVEAERLERVLTAARLSAAPHLPFVLAATSPTDFDNRMALIEDRLFAVASSVTEGDAVLSGVVHTALKTQAAEDFEVVHEARLAEQRKAAGRRAKHAAEEKARFRERSGVDQGRTIARRVAAIEKDGYEDGYDTGYQEAKAGTPLDALLSQRGRDGIRGNDKDAFWKGIEEGYADAEAGRPAKHDLPTKDSERYAARRTASEGQTCSVCGDKIAKDPDGSYHHDNGEKHDHEAKAGGSKESSRRRTASLNEWLKEEKGLDDAQILQFQSWLGTVSVQDYDGPEDLWAAWPGSKTASRRTAVSVGEVYPCKGCGRDAVVTDPTWGRFIFCPQCTAINEVRAQEDAAARAGRSDDQVLWDTVVQSGAPIVNLGSRRTASDIPVLPFSIIQNGAVFGRYPTRGAAEAAQKTFFGKTEIVEEGKTASRTAAGGFPFDKKDDGAEEKEGEAPAEETPTTDEASNPDIQSLLDAGYQAHTQGGKTLADAIAAGEPIQFTPPAAQPETPATPAQQTAASRLPFGGSKTASAGAYVLEADGLLPLRLHGGSPEAAIEQYTAYIGKSHAFRVESYGSAPGIWRVFNEQGDLLGWLREEHLFSGNGHVDDAADEIARYASRPLQAAAARSRLPFA